MHQLNTSHVWTIHGCNLEQLLVFKALRVGWQVHQSANRTPPTRGRSMYAIQNNFSFLGLYKMVDKCTSPPVKHLPRVDDPCMQSGSTPCFLGSLSQLLLNTQGGTIICTKCKQMVPWTGKLRMHKGTHICDRINQQNLKFTQEMGLLHLNLFQLSVWCEWVHIESAPFHCHS